jgi:hypothetical protein
MLKKSMSKKFLITFTAIFFAATFPLRAEDAKNFPNISGETLFLAQADNVISTDKKGVSPNNGFLYVQSDFGLNFNQNWAIKTQWRMQPNDTLTTRNQVYPERYRTFLQHNRGFGVDDTALLVEELKLDFKNEDMNFYVGKFDPTFGTAYKKSKRIGIFTWQIAEDYNLREKIGGGVSAFLENSKITFNTFFNDTTGLSTSAIHDRGRAQTNNGLAGNTGTLSSYSVAMEGENLLGVENLFYNLGYRSLGTDKIPGRRREQGYVANVEYLYQLGIMTSIIPYAEVVKINDFTGEKNRDAIYSTFALIGKYSAWNASVSYITRNIKQNQRSYNISDNLLQLSVGYKFTDNLTVDVTRANLKEGTYHAGLVGISVSYVYKF